MRRNSITEWTSKQDPTICCLQGIYFRFKDTPESERTEKDMKIKRAGLAILIQDKTDFKLKLSQQTKTYDDKEVNLPRGCNNCKYTCTLN